MRWARSCIKETDSEGATVLLFDEMLRSFFLSMVEQYIVEETLKIINLLFLVSELQTIINSTQRTIQKALRVYCLSMLLRSFFLSTLQQTYMFVQSVSHHTSKHICVSKVFPTITGCYSAIETMNNN